MTTAELTKQDEKAVEAEEAYAVETQIKAALADGREALWRLAEALHAFDEMRGWLKLDHDTLGSWLADADVTLTKGTYYRLVRTWRKLVVERKIDAGRVRLLDQSKVAIVVDKVAEGKATVDEAFADVEAMGASDLREKYYGPKKVKEPSVDPAKTDPEPSGQEAEGEPAGGEDMHDAVRARLADLSDDDLDEITGSGDVNYIERQIATELMAEREATRYGEGLDPSSGDDDDGGGDDPLEGEVVDAEPELTDGAVLDVVLDEAKALPWNELDTAYKSGAAYPRMPREAVAAFLAWRKKHLS